MFHFSWNWISSLIKNVIRIQLSLHFPSSSQWCFCCQHLMGPYTVCLAICTQFDAEWNVAWSELTVKSRSVIKFVWSWNPVYTFYWNRNGLLLLFRCRTAVYLIDICAPLLSHRSLADGRCDFHSVAQTVLCHTPRQQISSLILGVSRS